MNSSHFYAHVLVHELFLIHLTPLYHNI